MDTPSRFETVSLVCKCGASLTHTDFAFRVGVAEEEFRAQHVTAFCGVTAPPPFRPACVGTFYGNEYDAFPCEVIDCPACAPHRKKGED